MKKFIYFLFALCILAAVSCKNPNTNKDAKMTEDELMAKENKTLVEEKKYIAKEGNWWIYLTSKLEDTRTFDEIIDNVPLKEDIVNTITLDRRFDGFKSSNGMYFSVYLELQKTVKHDTKKITFV